MPRLPSTDRSATTIRLDLALKRRASIYALRRGINLSDAIEEGLRLLLAQPATAPRKPRPSAPRLPGLDEPAGGSVKGEPQDVQERHVEQPTHDG